MKKYIIGLSAITMIFIASCCHKSSPQNTDTPVLKENNITYATNVQPLILTKCTPCHIPANGGFKAALDTYETAGKYIDDIIKRVELDPSAQGFMPLKHPKLSDDEIDVFKKWRDNGLKQN